MTWLRKLFLVMPMRPRAFLALVMLLAVAWAPLLVAVVESWRWFAQEVRDCYSGWADAVKTAAKALVTGERQ
jgi:hypothetical protein